MTVTAPVGGVWAMKSGDFQPANFASTASGIQAALDYVSGGGRVYVGPGSYTTTASLTIGSGVTIELDPAAIIIRGWNDTHTIANATIRNSDQSSGNAGITVIGGQVTSTGTNRGMQYGFAKVDRLIMSDFAVTDSYQSWMVFLSDCTNATLDNFSLTSVSLAAEEDGLHIEGGQYISVSNFAIHAGDDAIIIAQQNATAATDATDITISNGTAHSELDRAFAITADNNQTPTATRAIRRVEASNLSLSHKATNGIILQDNVNGGASSYISDIKLSNIHLDSSSVPSGSVETVHLFGPTRVTVSGLYVQEPYYIGINVQGAVDVTLTDCHVWGTRGTAPSINIDTGASNNIKFIGGSYLSGTQNGVTFVATNGVTDIEFIGVAINGAAGDGIKLAGTVTRARVEGCRITNNSGYGVNVSASTVADAQVLNNTMLTNTSGAITDSGTRSIFAGNKTGASDNIYRIGPGGTGSYNAILSVEGGSNGSTQSELRLAPNGTNKVALVYNNSNTFLDVTGALFLRQGIGGTSMGGWNSSGALSIPAAGALTVGNLTSGTYPKTSTAGLIIDGPTPLAGSKVYYVSDTSGGAVTRKLTFTDGILTAET